MVLPLSQFCDLTHSLSERQYSGTNYHAHTGHTPVRFTEYRFVINSSGRIAQVVGLQTTEYLLKEEEFLPWEAATANLRYIEDMLARSDSYGLFEVGPIGALYY